MVERVFIQLISSLLPLDRCRDRVVMRHDQEQLFHNLVDVVVRGQCSWFPMSQHHGAGFFSLFKWALPGLTSRPPRPLAILLIFAFRKPTPKRSSRSR